MCCSIAAGVFKEADYVMRLEREVCGVLDGTWLVERVVSMGVLLPLQ